MKLHAARGVQQRTRTMTDRTEDNMIDNESLEKETADQVMRIHMEAGDMRRSGEPADHIWDWMDVYDMNWAWRIDFAHREELRGCAEALAAAMLEFVPQTSLSEENVSEHARRISKVASQAINNIDQRFNNLRSGFKHALNEIRNDRTPSRSTFDFSPPTIDEQETAEANLKRNLVLNLLNQALEKQRGNENER